MQRAQYLHSGQSGSDGNVSGLRISNLPHHDHVWVLPEDAPQRGHESEVELGVRRNLDDSLDAPLDRVLDGDERP